MAELRRFEVIMSDEDKPIGRETLQKWATIPDGDYELSWGRYGVYVRVWRSPYVKDLGHTIHQFVFSKTPFTEDTGVEAFGQTTPGATFSVRVVSEGDHPYVAVFAGEHVVGPEEIYCGSLGNSIDGKQLDANRSFAAELGVEIPTYDPQYPRVQEVFSDGCNLQDFAQTEVVDALETLHNATSQEP